MADAELHIHIAGPIDITKLDALLNAAMALNKPKAETKVPAGYKCIECYQENGGHSSDCSIGMEAKR